MDVSLQTLEQITSPLEVVNLLGKDLVKDSSAYYNTKCPKCESKLFLVDRELVCENYNCVFRAGSVCDYLVASKLCTWDTALDTLNQILDNRLDNTVIIKNKKLLTQKLKDKRKLFDFFLKMSLYGSINNIENIQFKNALRHQGIDVESLRQSVFVIGGQDVSNLKNLVKGVESKAGSTCIVLPYFSDYHTVSHLVLLNSPKSNPDLIPVYPSRISYFGLLHRHPTSTNTKFAYTYADAAKLNTQYKRLTPENVCLHMLLDATQSGGSISIKDAQYVVTDETNDDFKAVALLQKYINNLDISTTNNAMVGASSVDDFLASKIIKCIKNGGSVIPMLELANLNNKSRQALLHKLHENRYFDAADEVRNFFQSLPIYSDDKNTLYKNPFGYSLKKNNKDINTVFITNFVIELEENIVFAESTDIFHAGNIIFDGSTYPILIKQEAIERASDLEKAVRTATLSVSNEFSNNLPTVKERGAAKYITTYLREQISVLPRSEGVPMLGWSPRRTSFYSPYFISDRKGSRVGKKYFHPSNTALSLFTNELNDLSHIHFDLPEPITQIINQCAAMITRSYLSMPTKAIPVYNNAEARALLSSMFSALGQTSVSQLNHNIRGEEAPGIRGFPHYSVGYVASQVNKSSLTSFILCDGGVTISQHFSPEVLEQSKQTLKFIVQKVAEWAIKTEAASFTQVNSVSRTNAYISEGCQVIIDACNLLSWPSSKTPFETLDGLLANLKIDEVKQYFVKDIHRHITQIKKDLFTSSTDLNKVTEELQLLSNRVLVTDDTIDVDSDSITEALTSYYHTMPVLTEKFDADKLLNDLNLR
jgi:hypothetical protein